MPHLESTHGVHKRKAVHEDDFLGFHVCPQSSVVRDDPQSDGQATHLGPQQPTAPSHPRSRLRPARRTSRRSSHRSRPLDEPQDVAENRASQPQPEEESVEHGDDGSGKEQAVRLRPWTPKTRPSTRSTRSRLLSMSLLNQHVRRAPSILSSTWRASHSKRIATRGLRMSHVAYGDVQEAQIGRAHV